MGAAEEEAWVTLATNDTYALGALVLAHSIRSAGTSRRLVALVTPGVTMAMRDQLSGTFDLVEMVNVLDSGDTANLALLSRPDLGVTFTKLHCWRLTQFSKCVFLDADTLMLQPCDELFDREELSAAPDAGWPDCFNSGVFVFRPSMETYQKLLAFAVSHGSFDGGDQGLLNSFFSDWASKDISRHLPFIYNMVSTATYSYLPAYKKFGETVRIAHFIGASKPWLQPFDSESRKVRVSADQEHQRMLLQIWWDIFCYHVHPRLSMDMRHRASLVPQLENSTPAHFVHILFENFHPNVFEPQLSHFDEEEWWVESNEPPSNPTIKQIACLPNLPRDDPPEPCKEQPGEVGTDPLSGHSEMPPCMEVSLEPQIPYSAPPAQPPSPQQSSVCLRSPLVTMVEEEAEREASMHSVEKARMPQCADPSPDAEGGLASAFSKMVLDAPKSEEQSALEDHLRRQAWEVGQIDYLGQDSFENIWKKIMHTINTGPSSKAEPSQPAPPPAEVPQSQPASIPSAPPQPSPAPAPQAPAPPPKAPSPPKVAPTPPKATPPPPIVTPSPDVAPPTPMSPESTSPVQPSAPPPTPVKPTVPSPPPAAEPAATPAVAPAKVAATAAPPSPAPAATKASPPKAAPAATPEEGAKGTAPVAPKRKGGAQQQQGGSGRGKSAGQKGKK